MGVRKPAVEFAPPSSLELERLQEALARKQALIDAMMQASYDGLCLLSGDAVFLEMNAAFERMTGLKRETWVGRALKEMQSEPGITRRSAALQVLNGSYPASTLVNIRGGDMMLVTANPHFGESGELQYIILNLRNITHLNYLKYQLEKDRGAAKLSELEEFGTAYLRDKLRAAGFADFVLQSSIMRKIVGTVMTIGDFDFTVLLEGETGVGKGLMAALIHRLGSRAAKPLIEVNCAAIPENLVESEMFGHDAGAFTGSSRTGKPGYFEAANGGTIFLDEIGELPRGAQAKLLKVLDDKTVMRVGSTVSRRVDVRVIAATNQNLRDLVRRGLFRADLLYRLEVIPITIPPLRDRPDDIKALAYRFLDHFNREFRTDKVLGTEALQYLLTYEMPGNVRQLKNLMARLVLTCPAKEIALSHVLAELQPHGGSVPVDGPSPAACTPAPAAEPAPTPRSPRSMREHLAEIERALLARYAQECRSTYEVAARLGMNQSSVVRKMKKYGITRAEH
jgi:PAS domain S-box-containing protein